MNKRKNSPFLIFFAGFILMNILGGVVYRFYWWFENSMIWFIWILLFLGASIILIWGIKLRISQYESEISTYF
jgi:hypothetical protein